MNILNVRRMHKGRQKKTIGIGDDLPLAPMVALAWIEATEPSGRHRVLPRIFANPKESQLAEITHSFLVRL